MIEQIQQLARIQVVLLLALVLGCADDQRPTDAKPADSQAMASEAMAGTTSNEPALGEAGQNAQGGSGTGGDSTDAGSGPGSAAAGTPGASTGMPERPYANVVNVVSSGSEGSYTFDVSIESADIDCTQYADWWEVLSQDGALLYRRILTHSHTDENGTTDADAPGNTFTRSGGPVAIPPDEVVIVRAHANTEGYNGAVMRGSPGSGFAAAPEIDSDFAAAVEGEDPQPTGCSF